MCIAAAAAMVLSLSGCSAAEPMNIGEGVTHYRALAKELTAALAAEYPSVGWTREGADTLDLDQDGRTCEFFPASFKSKQSLEEASPGFTEVMAAVNPVLQKFHFDTVERLSEVPGGWTVIKSADKHGAEVKLAAKGSTRGSTLLVLQAPLAGDCQADVPPYGD